MVPVLLGLGDIDIPSRDEHSQTLNLRILNSYEFLHCLYIFFHDFFFCLVNDGRHSGSPVEGY